MKITKSQLKKLIREAVKEQLNEVSEDAQVAFERFLELKKFSDDFRLLARVGPEVVQEILDIRDVSKDYSEFFKQVGPGPYDHTQGRSVPNNKFGMRPEKVKAFWEGGESGSTYPNKLGSLPISKLMSMMKEFDKLKKRFVYKSTTSHADAVYGRRRTSVIDTETGKTMSSTTDRKGSLGT